MNKIREIKNKTIIQRFAIRLGVDPNSRRVFALLVVNFLFTSFALVFLTHNLIQALLGNEVFNSITMRGALMLVCSMISIWFVKKSIKISAYLTSFIPVLVLYIYPFIGIPDQSVNEALFINMMGLFITCPIPFILFSAKRDFKAILLFNIGVFFLHAIIQFNHVYYRLPVESDLVFYFQRNFLLLFIFQFSIWQILFWVLYSSYVKNERYQDALKAYNKVVHEQKFEIEAQNEELKQQQDHVNSMNERLESLVLERTQKLLNQNAKLIEYAYINSHLLRAPLCRIQGLRNLMDFDPEKAHQYKEFFDQSVEELNRVIENIALMLNDEDSEIFNDSQDQK